MNKFGFWLKTFLWISFPWFSARKFGRYGIIEGMSADSGCALVQQQTGIMVWTKGVRPFDEQEYSKISMAALSLRLFIKRSFMPLVITVTTAALFVKGVPYLNCLAMVYIATILIMRYRNYSKGMLREHPQYHALEHQTIALLCLDIPIALDNLKRMSRITWACGSRILFWELLGGVWFTIFNPYWTILYIASSLILMFIIQRFIITAEPTENQHREGIIMARKARSVFKLSK
ncbi:DUF1385 domain-containing protein [Candidatus Jorgensenbacteria bacterium]|nr:DUF1385 domain-containing protein [Candidatus Jorgensenbacteria bacterium]